MSEVAARLQDLPHSTRLMSLLMFHRFEGRMVATTMASIFAENAIEQSSFPVRTRRSLPYCFGVEPLTFSLLCKQRSWGQAVGSGDLLSMLPGNSGTNRNAMFARKEGGILISCYFGNFTALALRRA